MKYIVKQGDTLQFISMQFFGTFVRWPEIWNRNREIIEARQQNDYCRTHGLKGPDWLFPGTELIIPEDHK